MIINHTKVETCFWIYGVYFLHVDSDALYEEPFMLQPASTTADLLRVLKDLEDTKK